MERAALTSDGFSRRGVTAGVAFAALVAVKAAVGGELSDLATGGTPWVCKLPGENTRLVRFEGDLSEAESLRLSVRLLKNPSALVRVLFFCQNAEGWYYQTATTEPLRAGRKHEFTWSLANDSADLQPVGHFRPWDLRAGRSVRAAGLKVFANRPCEVRLEVGGVRLEPAGQHSSSEGDPPKLLDCRLPSEAVAAGSRMEISFRLSPEPAHPFSSEAPVKAVFITPSGTRQKSSAFYFQDFRPVGPSLARRLAPSDRPRWLVRYVPAEPGRYRYRLTWGDEILGSGWFEATASGAEARHKAGPPSDWLFEGTAVAPSDFVVDLTRIYGEAGPSLIPTERASICEGGAWKVGRIKAPSKGWWVPLEWHPGWGKWSRGEYQMQVAWLFDRALEAAEAAGKSMPFVLLHDGVFFDQGKYRWSMNPLNAACGGPLKAPGDYFQSEAALADFRRNARYVAARWGYSPAVSEWCLGTRLAANGVDEWHEKVRQAVSEADPFGKRLMSLSFLPTGFAKRGRLGTFERGNVWRVDEERSPSARILVTDKTASEGRRSLRVSGSFPREHVWIWRELDENLFEYPLLWLDVFVPAEGPKDLRVQAYLRDGDLLWYEMMTPTMLRRGDWTKVLVPLDRGAPMKAVGHSMPWGDYSRMRIKEVGLKFYCPQRYSGAFYLDNVLVVGAPAGGPLPEPCRVVLSSALPDEVRTFDLLEIPFTLNRHYMNPFDPQVVDVSAVVRRPDGKTENVPAFWYQGYERSLQERNTTHGRCKIEVLEPAGAPRWKVRYAPTIAGEHSVEIIVREPDGEVARRGPMRFFAVASEKPGYVRVAADGRHLELSTGEFFYPIGMNLRSPTDQRDLGRDPQIRNDVILAGHRGTYQYDDYFEAMERSGMNWARIWMCPWWCGLEWYRKWPGYAGRGVYNLKNAWRMDYLLSEARRRRIYAQICTMNHGQLSPRIDHEWELNPLNYYDADAYAPTQKDRDIRVVNADRVRPRGLLKTATEFFTDKRAEASHRNKLRYIVARWGYSTSVMAWVLSSEVEFTEEYWQRHYNGDNYSPMVAAWHRDTARYLKQIDPWKHVVTTHFSHPVRGRATQRLPEMEFLQSNAYSSFTWFGGGGASWRDVEERRRRFEKIGRGNEARRLRPPVGAPRAMDVYFFRFMREFMRPIGKPDLTTERPVLIGEWGGHWMKNSSDVLDAELHTGLWASMATPMAGATGYWWWPHVHFRDRYGHYAGLVKFMAGEDRRGLGLDRAKVSLAGPGASSLTAMGVQTKEYADVYVYHNAAIRTLKGIRPVPGVKLVVQGLAQGPFAAEFWNTFSGKPVGRARAQAAGGRLELELPTVRTDLAVKIRSDRGRAGR